MQFPPLSIRTNRRCTGDAEPESDHRHRRRQTARCPTGTAISWGRPHNDESPHSPALCAHVDRLTVIINGDNHFGDEVAHPFVARIRVGQRSCRTADGRAVPGVVRIDSDRRRTDVQGVR
ncbi:hypothetical protein A2J04_20780 [Rhodococcus sp. EPR-279]|nr:hypothetical protein A2J02_19140 [Rhodococcus sp. EPR-147]KZF10287.1 hypothetical protein A2J04_20780 [Rhodococcus sp. EPR-279]